MLQAWQLKRWLMGGIVFLVFTSCTFSSPQPITPTPTFQQATSISPPKQEITSTLPAPTPPPQEIPTEKAAQNSPPLNYDNVHNLVVTELLGLSDWIQQILWFGKSSQIPGSPENHADFLIRVADNLIPMTIATSQAGKAIPLPADGEHILAIAPDASSLVIRDNQNAGIYHLDKQLIGAIENPDAVYGALYSSDGKYVAVTYRDQWVVLLYDAINGSKLAYLTGFETAAPIYGVIPAPGGKTIAWFARATLQIQDVATQKMGADVREQDFIMQNEFSPDGALIALCAGDQFEIYDVNSGSLVSHLTTKMPARGLGFSPDGKMIMLLIQGELQFFDVPSLTPITAISMPQDTNQAGFSPDGAYIIATTDDQKVLYVHLP